MNLYKKNVIFIICLITIISCNNRNEQKNKIVAIVNNQNIYLSQIDSIAANQLYYDRLDALELILSREILTYEAKKQKITKKELIEEHINSKCKKVTKLDIDRYIRKNGILNADTSNIRLYLLNVYRKDLQEKYVDSLKKIYSVKIKLIPPFLKVIDTKQIYSHNLTKNDSKIKVFIISDFRCPHCQKAEKTLKELYLRYNNKVNFKFVYYSYYIGKDALACEAAAKQNKFKEMHNIIFENSDILEQDSVFYMFAKKINLDIKTFNSDMKDKNVLNKLIKNRETLKTKEIYSTPVFIINGKVLDDKYSLDYLEDMIIGELNK